MKRIFCGKSLKYGWLEGYYIKTGAKENKTHYIVQDISSLNKLACCKVESKTVCQYTGKKDINGMRIFENFIIKEEDYGCIGIVKFGEYGSGYGYYIKWISEKAKYYRQDFLYWQKHDHIQVIGNIFDNSEMLQE